VGSANVGAIVGGVLSGVLVLIVASISYYCLKHRRKRAHARLMPSPVVTQVPPLYQPYIPAKLAGRAPYNLPHGGPAGANLPVSSQHMLPLHHNVHSTSYISPVVPRDTLSTTLGTSQSPSMLASASVSYPHASPQPGHLYSTNNRNQAISSSADETAEQGLLSRRYSPQSLPPPYTPNA